jgi:hypothetical protein
MLLTKEAQIKMWSNETHEAQGVASSCESIHNRTFIPSDRRELEVVDATIAITRVRIVQSPEQIKGRLWYVCQSA